MLKIGLEREFFCLNQANEVCLVPENLPKDECGWLLEARGKPFEDIVEAVFSLRASQYHIEQELYKYNTRNRHPSEDELHITDTPVMKVSRKIRTEALRRNEKGRYKYKNFYGYDNHRNATGEATASLHIHFNDERKLSLDNNVKTFNANFDWPFIFTSLDREFAEEIKEAKRNKGFYELKPDGRVEYRSLPSNINLDKLIEVLKKILSDLN